MYGEVIAIAAMLAVVIGGLIYQVRAGLLSPTAFAQSPRRAGAMEAYDIFVTIGLWLIGSMAGGQIGLQWVGDDKTPRAMLYLTACSQGGSLLAVVYVYVRAHLVVHGGIGGFGLNARSLGQSMVRTLATLLFIIPATFVTLGVMAAVSEALGYPVPKLAHTLLESIRDAESPGVKTGLLLLPILLAPLIEETIFRGMLQTALLQATSLSRWSVIALVSVIFAGIHGAFVPPQSIPGLFVLALGLGFVYERTGKLWAPMLIHAVFNAVNVTLVLTGLVTD